MHPCSYLSCRGAQSGGAAHCPLHHTSMHIQVLKLLLKLCHHLIDLEDGEQVHTTPHHTTPHHTTPHHTTPHHTTSCNLHPLHAIHTHTETVTMQYKDYHTGQTTQTEDKVAQPFYLSPAYLCIYPSPFTAPAYLCIYPSPFQGPLRPAPCRVPARPHPTA